MSQLINLVLLILLMTAALSALVLRDILGAIIAFSSYSLIMAIIWQRLYAPDLALTEAAVGAGITTVLFVITLFKTRGKKP
ncbi:MAG: hydrogenase subunit MbhD domain-containing protein [Chloroflexota bacterium]